jgi:hypothetical protein
LANTAEQVDDDELVLAGGDRAFLAAWLGIATADINALA